MQAIIEFIVQTVGDLGYTGIFIMMLLESSFFPFPSEVVMVPAGYLAYKGQMSLFWAIFAGIAGSLTGALLNYYLAVKLGRKFLMRYGKYVLLKEHSLNKMERFFQDHGHISTFSGRLIPAVRQYISFPAGLAKMNLFAFSIYTSLGAAIWVTILSLLGYFIGQNQDIIDEYLKIATIITIALVLVLIIFYIRIKLKKSIFKKQ